MLKYEAELSCREMGKRTKDVLGVRDDIGRLPMRNNGGRLTGGWEEGGGKEW